MRGLIVLIMALTVLMLNTVNASELATTNIDSYLPFKDKLTVALRDTDSDDSPLGECTAVCGLPEDRE